MSERRVNPPGEVGEEFVETGPKRGTIEALINKQTLTHWKHQEVQAIRAPSQEIPWSEQNQPDTSSLTAAGAIFPECSATLPNDSFEASKKASKMFDPEPCLAIG